MESVNALTILNFELGVQSGSNRPIYKYRTPANRAIRFTGTPNVTFLRPPVINAKCIIGTENYPKASLNWFYEW